MKLSIFKVAVKIAMSLIFALAFCIAGFTQSTDSTVNDETASATLKPHKPKPVICTTKTAGRIINFSLDLI